VRKVELNYSHQGRGHERGAGACKGEIERGPFFPSESQGVYVCGSYILSFRRKKGQKELLFCTNESQDLCRKLNKTLKILIYNYILFWLWDKKCQAIETWYISVSVPFPPNLFKIYVN
jgi:hypothetical protein